MRERERRCKSVCEREVGIGRDHKTNLPKYSTVHLNGSFSLSLSLSTLKDAQVSDRICERVCMSM